MEINPFNFDFGPHFNNTMTCDVIENDCCGILFGEPHQYDERATYDSYHNILCEDGVTYNIDSTS